MFELIILNPWLCEPHVIQDFINNKLFLFYFNQMKNGEKKNLKINIFKIFMRMSSAMKLRFDIGVLEEKSKT